LLATTPRVPLTRLDNADPELMAELLEAVAAVAAGAAFTLGPEVEAFEDELAAYCGTKYAVGVSSGTEALALTLRALGIGSGDEVVVPANSFVATAEAVSLVGATPRFVDVDPQTALITAETVAAGLGPRTRGVIPVHLYGRTVDLDPIIALAAERGIRVIEDACQAHGAWLDGRRVGSVADAGCFSFYPGKNLGGWGDGGAVISDDDRLVDRIRLLRAHGERRRYDHELVGTTARLDALQAAVLRIKLRRLDRWNECRRRAAAELMSALRDGPVSPPAPAINGFDHVFHQFVVTTGDRDGLRRHLAAAGIASAIHYPVPIHRTKAYTSRDRLPVSERLAGRICSLPIYPQMSSDEIRLVSEAIRDFAD
jgi:dTDP-4-amino-4,6-dideoxygalactose transaminase